MKFNVNQNDLQKSLGYCQGVIEKRSTLPILSNILLDATGSKLKIIATDLDLIFVTELKNVEILQEGKTTTTSSIMYDIIRKFNSGNKINFNQTGENKIQLESEKSIFNLNCISASEFPITEENFGSHEFIIKSKELLKLLNKCKFSISNDETRHYLSGIYIHQTRLEDKSYLTAAATDSHRMSISKILLKEEIKFEMENSILVSKLIDGKFPNYIQVIPKNNKKRLEIDLKLFMSSVDRVASVSLDKKDSVKFILTKDKLNLSVNNASSGDGNETINVSFDHELNISFNSRYLIDIASQLDGDKIELYLNETGSPALIKDPSDFDSIYVVMPMKG